MDEIKAGSITKLTPSVTEKICGYVRVGHIWRDAAILSGIRETSFHVWMDRGRRSRGGKCRTLIEALQKAEEEYKKFLIIHSRKGR
ncbi:MAG: hypothetical protein ACI8ZB_002574 [Desulforhopalus sp.]|jgi:hypothetical protein